MPDLTYDIARESDRWPDEEDLRKLTRKVIGVLRPHIKGHVTFVFSDDDMVQVLNREWRGKDKPTNVLSFPDGDADEDGVVHLGDVIVAQQTLDREAKEMAISFDDHLTHLLLHGALHLAGYDHETDTEAKTMESLEIQLLASLGIKDPYQDGAQPLD